MAIKIFISVMLSVLLTTDLYSQCSDAGVCALGGHKETTPASLSLTYQYGSNSKDDFSFHTMKLGSIIPITDDIRLSGSLPISSQSGTLGKTTGIGDVTVLASISIMKISEAVIEGQVGGKFATGSTNDGSLPQAYQTGLGTNDALFGISLYNDRLNISAAYQISRERSNNTVDRLRRGDDVMVRLGYSTKVYEYDASLEVFYIKRLHESSVRDSAQSVLQGKDVFQVLAGSDQAQINIVGTLSVLISSDFIMRGSFALPLLKRSINVDGLTRTWTVSLGIEYMFAVN